MIAAIILIGCGGLLGCILAIEGIDLRLQHNRLRRLLGHVTIQLRLLAFQFGTAGFAFCAQLVKRVALGLCGGGSLLCGCSLFISCGFQIGDLLFDCGKTFATVHRRVQRIRRIAGRIGLGTAQRITRLHGVDELLRTCGTGHHAHHGGCVGTMHIFTSHLRHGRMRVVVVLARLLNLRFEVFLVFLRRFQTGSGSLRLALRRSGSGIGLIDLSLGRRNLRIRQFVQLDDLVCQIGLHARKLRTQPRFPLCAIGLLILRVHQIAIRICMRLRNNRRERGDRHRGAHSPRCKHRSGRLESFFAYHSVTCLPSLFHTIASHA